MEWTSIIKPPFGTPLDLTHPLSKGLVASYLFNEGSGKIVNDSSGQGNNGLCVNMNDSPISTSGWNPSPQGGGLAFDGANDCVKISSTNSQLPNFTVSVWVKGNLNAAQSSGFNAVILKYSSNSYENFGFYWIHNQTGYFQAWDITVGTGYYPAKYTTSLLANIWYNIAATYDGENLKAYLNGKLETTNTSPSGSANTGGNGLTVGGGGTYATPANFFNGSINDVRIYNRALSAEEIAYLYAFPYCMYEDDQYFPYNRLYRRYAIDSRSGIGVM